jgi:5-methylcytosine-specific restriction endonuclease McrA
VAVRTGTCERCDGAVASGGRGAVPRFCETCRKARHAARVRATNALARPVQVRTCQSCGSDYPAPGRDTKSLRCPPCRPSARRVTKGTWAQANTDRTSESKARWRDANMAAVRATKRARHEVVALGERFDPREIFQRDWWICQLCFKPVDSRLAHPDYWSASLDHVIPLARGGAHTRSNTQLAHLHCNRVKHARLPEGVTQSG